MALAYDMGVTHYDVARSYGFGEAERVVGRFASDKRHQITIATKFGILPSVISAPARFAKPAVRFARKVLPGIGKLVRRASSGLLESGHYSLREAKLSVETSLKELNVDRIDILFIHDCRRNSDLDGDLIDFLDSLVESGKIAMWGVATDGDDADHFRAWLPSSMQVLQRNVCFDSDMSSERRIVMHSLFSFANKLFATESAQPISPLMSWSRSEGMDASQLRAALPFLLLEAVTYGSDIVALCSMISPDHIRRNVDSMSTRPFTPAQILSFRLSIQEVNERSRRAK
jgi:aryl-alcohol dehydrogenase-like predicted oxidoreductase